MSDIHAELNIKQMKTTHKILASIKDIGSKNGIFVNEEELDYSAHECFNNDLITNQTFIGLVPNKDFDIDFLYSLFEAPTTKNKLLKLSAGSTIFYIARESFENLVLSVPSKVEQIKISKIFKSIDNSITLHQ